MKIGIVGPADRSVAWENHLRSHQFVTEVIIAGSLDDIGQVNACFLLDDSEQRLQNLLKAIKGGYHTFFISSLPTDPNLVEKIYHTSQEANVRVQFSHWPTLAPASQWMVQKVQKPTFIQTTEEMAYTSFLENSTSFKTLWVDELAYCLKYIGGAIHHTQINTSRLESGKPYATHLHVRFDSGATASIFVSVCALNSRHKRLVSDHTLLLDCDVESQTIRIGREHENNHLFFEKKTFDPALAAEQSAMQFLKAIQLKKATLYNSYDLLQLVKTVESINQRI